MNKEPIIFIDTEDMEERYAEGLYMDYLKEENQQLRTIISELEKWLKKEMAYKDVEKKLQELKGEYEKD